MCRDEIRARVETAPWSFFHFPVECWTHELALVAWRQVRFVLARVPSDFSPELYFEIGNWDQFLELLCESPIVAALATASNPRDWQSVVSCIDDHLQSRGVNEAGEHLPDFSDL